MVGVLSIRNDYSKNEVLLKKRSNLKHDYSVLLVKNQKIIMQMRFSVYFTRWAIFVKVITKIQKQ